MAQRVLKAIDEDDRLGIAEIDRRCIPHDSRQSDFDSCVLCACRWRRVVMWGYKVYIMEIRFNHWSTFAPWAQQTPPSDEVRRTCPDLAELFDACVVMGMQSDDHGLFIPGLQLPWQQYWIRSEDTEEDRELVEGLKVGWSFEFDEEHQPPVLGWDRDRVLSQVAAMSDKNWDFMVANFDRWAAIGEFEWELEQRQEEEHWKKWEGPLSAPPPTMTPQHMVEKQTLEITEDGTELWEDDHRIIADLKVTGVNEASQTESATTYSTPQDFTEILVPNGAVVRADEPKAFTGKPSHWKEHSVVTVVRPKSLAQHRREVIRRGAKAVRGAPMKRTEQFYRACYWVFGGKHFPRLQMRYGRFVIRMLQRGYDATTYTDMSTKATPMAAPDVWRCLIMDDYGECVGHEPRDDGRYVYADSKAAGDIKFDRIAGLQKQGNLGQEIKIKKKIVHARGPYGGREMCPYDPMERMATGGIGNAKIRVIELMGAHILSNLDRGLILTRRGWSKFLGLCNDAGPWCQMRHLFIEMVYILWPRGRYPPVGWTERGDPSFRSDAKRKTLQILDWRPSIKHEDMPSWEAPCQDEFATENGIVARALVEQWVRELKDRAVVPVFTGLPLPGLWRGQISQTPAELMALPKGEFHTVEGIPFLATDATLTRGGVVLGRREVATIDFEGDLHVQHTEMRSLHVGCVHFEHELLPPSSQRMVLDRPTYIPSANRWSEASREEQPELALVQPRYATRRTDLAFLASGRVVALVDNIGIVHNVNNGYSTNERTNLDIRDSTEWRRHRSMYLYVLYIWTKINIADLPTRFLMKAFTESIWFTDEIWEYLHSKHGLDLRITAEAYADEQNARSHAALVPPIRTV